MLCLEILSLLCSPIANIGYCNITKNKNCIDSEMTVYIKKLKANNLTKDYEFRKENTFIILKRISSSAYKNFRFFENAIKH